MCKNNQPQSSHISLLRRAIFKVDRKAIIDLTCKYQEIARFCYKVTLQAEKQPTTLVSQYLPIWHLYLENLASNVSNVRAQELTNAWGFAKLLLSGRKIDCDLRIVRFLCLCVCAALFIYKECKQSSVCRSGAETLCNRPLFCWCFQVCLSS